MFHKMAKKRLLIIVLSPVLVLAVALPLAIFFGVVNDGNTSETAPWEITETSARKTSPEIIERVKSGELTELTVELEVPSATDMRNQIESSAEWISGNLTILEAKCMEYETIKNRILYPSDLNIRQIAELETLPYMLVKIEGPLQLAYLLQHDDVRAIYQREILQKLAEPALELVGQRLARAAGFIGVGSTVAVLDTGVDLSHSDFGGCTSVGEPDCCRILADVEIADYPNDPCEDTDHGTTIARVITQVAPGASIVSLDVDADVGLMPGCDTNSDELLKATNWVIKNKDTYNIKVINISYASKGHAYSDTNCSARMDRAFDELSSYGIATIAASGNDGLTTGVGWPACSKCAISVGAVNSNDTVAYYTNRGQNLDLLAPTLLDWGTSTAAPVVAAIWAIVENNTSNLSVDQILTLLKETGHPVYDPETELVFPRVQIDAAMNIEGDILDQIEQGDRFGSCATSGDFNGDNFADLAIGVPGEVIEGQFYSPIGSVNIIFGSVNGLSINANQVVRVSVNTLGSGDFNGDGFSDLAVGAPFAAEPSVPYWEPRNEGLVYVFYGSVNGVEGPQTLSQISNEITGEVPDGESGDLFGYAVATGDFNGDYYTDLAIGVPNESEDIGWPYAGVVHIIYGGDNGLNSANSQIWHQGQPGIAGNPEFEDEFGKSLAAGDFNGDGYDDLAIGVPGESVAQDSDAGAVNIIYGSAAGLTATNNQVWTQDSSPFGSYSAEPGDFFGSSLASGDFDGNGADDLAIGVPGEDLSDNSINSAGVVHVLMGCPVVSPWGVATPCDPGLTSVNAYHITQSVKTNFAYFGQSLCAANFNGDHYYGICACAADGMCGCRIDYADLAIGASGDSPPFRSGTVEVLYGNPQGTLSNRQIWRQGSAELSESREINDYFGYSLAHGDFDGNGVDDLAIGVPFEDVMSPIYAVRPGCPVIANQMADDAGIVHVIYGTEEGLFVLTTVGGCWPEPCDPGVSNPQGARQSQTWSQGR